MPLYNFTVQVSSGDALDVRRFSIKQRISSLFEVDLVAHTENAYLDFDALVGQPATFQIHAGASGEARSWSGICNHVQHVGVVEPGLSTYELRIVPTLWLATQRKNYRMFQQVTELDIVKKILGEWEGAPELRITGTYKRRKYRVQYGETDFAFLSRMLEEAGISFFFENGSTVVLSDAPQGHERRAAPLPYRDNPTAADREYVTKVRIGQQVRPGKVTLRDYDPRLAPTYKLMASATGGAGAEAQLEQFEYMPGAFQFRTDQGESTPFADDHGKVRSDEKEGAVLAKKRLDAQRGSAKLCSFETNVTDLAPGVVIAMQDHPRADGSGLLVISSEMEGDSYGAFLHRCEANSADVNYRPELSTLKPRVVGVESATVVGPAGEEIHTDEFGRVRVSFHWDRESTSDENSSCWIHVSQPWSGTAYGGTSLPRIGQEVLVDFLSGDPDQPVITGRVYTNLQKTPYKLPDHKTQSGWKSHSSPQTGGYNEIMFEDAAGLELLRMQAEKDLHKLVKHDEHVTIGNDRAKLVGHDDKLTVEHDRTKVVQDDERVTIGNDRTERVGRNETISIGNDRTENVGRNETISIGNDRTENVGHDETISIGNNRAESVGTDETISIGNDRTESVGHDEIITIGNDRMTMVRNDEIVIVGNNRAKAIQMNEREVVGANRTRMVGADENVEIGGRQGVNIGAAQGVVVGANQDVVVGADRSVMVGGNNSLAVALSSAEIVTQDSMESVGLTKTTTVGTAYQIFVGDSMSANVKTISREDVGLIKIISAGAMLELVCGAAKITLNMAGIITLEGIIVEKDPIKAAKDAEKHAASRAAVTSNDVAAVATGVAGACAAAAAYATYAAVATSPTGVGALAFGVAAGVLGIISGVAWFVGNRYQDHANDPPRNDFHDVSVFKPYPITLPPEINDAENTWRQFIEKSAFLALAIRNLTTSRERADGVAQAIKQAKTDDLEECQIRQEAAIQQNAGAAADLIDALVAKRDEVNTAWSRQVVVLQEARVDPSPDMARAASSQVSEANEPWMKNIVQCDDAEYARMSHAMKSQMLSSAWSKPPDVLLNDAWKDAMQQMSSALKRTARTPSGV